ncbi:MAG: hypothetical protein ACW99F_04535 [Candidatus Hodarchaeales archaeon]|jgi:hypothetical protein
MSEFFNVNLLGIIGTVTGILALLISWRTFSKQKPNLKIKIAKCEHNYPNLADKTKKKDIHFIAKFQVKNTGDRGTKIDKIALSFKSNDKKYKLDEINPLSDFSDMINISVKSTNQNSDRWIKAHDATDIWARFSSLFEGLEENQIDCTFHISDTHKEYILKATSKKGARPPFSPKPYRK